MGYADINVRIHSFIHSYTIQFAIIEYFTKIN
jgi:hypothetical protein